MKKFSEYLTEAVEQLNELSPAALLRYQTVASGSANKQNERLNRMKAIADTVDDVDTKNKAKSAAKIAKANVDKRLVGIDRAEDRLNKSRK